jgi:hypothetical protein
MRDTRKQERLRRLVMGAQLAAARVVASLFVEPGTTGRNLDADAPWKQCSTRTRAALLLTQGSMAAERARVQGATTQPFGMVVLMQGRIESHDEWEKMAAAAPRGRVIDAVPVREAVLRGPRALGEGAQELRADVRQETAAQVEAKAKGEVT